MSRIAIGGFVLTWLWFVGWTASAHGLTYLLVWFAASAPGVLLGLRVFGRHAAGWVAGAAGGYTLTCLTVWAVVAAQMASPAAFAIAWLVQCAVMAIVARQIPTPLVQLRPWTPRDTTALCAVLLLVPGLMAAPYRNLGAADAEGRTYYRAYFTADFVWHVALTAELGRFTMPPRNPYMADRDLHYYWTYFLVPAAVTASGARGLDDVESVLKVNAGCTAILLLASIFLFAWTSGSTAVATAGGVVLVVLASSAEGFAMFVDLLARGRPVSAFQDINVDAITSWWYNGLRIDGVHRTMFYTPQHGLSCALGLLGLLSASVSGSRASTGAIVASGLLLGLATTLNPFLGAAFSAIYGMGVLADAILARVPIRAVAAHWPAVVPPTLAIAWGIVNKMGEGAGAALTIGWIGFARNAPVATLLLGLGPVLVPAVAGFIPNPRLPAQPARVALIGLLFGLFLLYCVVLSERSWVGFRAGQILLATLTLPLARLLDGLLASRLRPLAPVIALVIVVVGSPTTIADTFNAADIRNRRVGPGFPWTLSVSPNQQQALAWVRNNTRSRAVVQAEPVVRGRGHWSFIPTFARRRTAAGLPISLLPQPEYDARSRRVQSIFTAPDMAEAHRVARRLRIEYLWVDRDERQAYPAGVQRLADASDFFRVVYSNEEVTVYAVR
jgi:hypothetical protein